MLKFKNFLLLIIILFSNSYLSNIWIEPKDELKIKKLELYSAKNNINIRTTTYPLNLNSLKNSTIISGGLFLVISLSSGESLLY